MGERVRVTYGQVKLLIEVKPVGETFKSSWACELCGKHAEIDATFADAGEAFTQAKETGKIHALVHRK